MYNNGMKTKLFKHQNSVRLLFHVYDIAIINETLTQGSQMQSMPYSRIQVFFSH